MISDNKLYYSEEKWHEDNPEVSDRSLCMSTLWVYCFADQLLIWSRSSQESLKLHESQPWFHGRIAGGRNAAERLLHDFCKGRINECGTFLVRESNVFVRNYIISIWYSDQSHICCCFHIDFIILTKSLIKTNIMLK